MCKPLNHKVEDKDSLHSALCEFMSVRSAMCVPIDDMELAGTEMPKGEYWYECTKHAEEHYKRAIGLLMQASEYQRKLENKLRTI